MTQFAVITGASSGIGLAFSRILAREGYDLLLAARSETELKKLSVELEKHHNVKVKILAIDLSTQGAADELWNSVKNTPVDVLINNAGFGEMSDVIENDPQKIESMIALNVTCLTRLSQLAAISMKKRSSGHIVNLGSIVSFFPAPHTAVYGATKAYVLSFSEALSEELAGTGVSVTALCPGPTKSDFAKNAGMGKARSMQGSIPTSEEVAEYGYRAMQKKKVVAVHGGKTKVSALVAPRLFTRGLVRKVVGKVQEK